MINSNYIIIMFPVYWFVRNGDNCAAFVESCSYQMSGRCNYGVIKDRNGAVLYVVKNKQNNYI